MDSQHPAVLVGAGVVKVTRDAFKAGSFGGRAIVHCDDAGSCDEIARVGSATRGRTRGSDGSGVVHQITSYEKRKELAELDARVEATQRELHLLGSSVGPSPAAGMDEGSIRHRRRRGG